MDDQIKEKLLERLNRVFRKGEEAKRSINVHSLGDSTIDSHLFYGFRSAALFFLESNFGKSNLYYKEFEGITQRPREQTLLSGYEILKSLKEDIENDYITSLRSIVSAEIFSDFLEMADYLLKKEFKDPAAVLIGGVLEEHLRQLCTKHEIPITKQKNDNNEVPKKAAEMNSDLYKNEKYDKVMMQSVSAWLTIRNDASHGNYNNYNAQQVRNMYEGVMDFISRYQI